MTLNGKAISWAIVAAGFGLIIFGLSNPGQTWPVRATIGLGVLALRQLWSAVSFALPGTGQGACSSHAHQSRQ